jgi:hypothetical protein
MCKMGVEAYVAYMDTRLLQPEMKHIFHLIDLGGAYNYCLAIGMHAHFLYRPQNKFIWYQKLKQI